MEFAPYHEYENLAKQYLSKYNQKISDESIGCVVTNLMLADFKFNDKIGNIHGFRKMYALFAIKSLRRFYHKNQHIIYTDDDKFLANIKYKNDFNENIFWEDIKKYLNNNEYSVIIGRYRMNKTLANISAEMKLSKQRIHQIQKQAIQKLKEQNVWETK